MSDKDGYSLSRAIASVLARGVPSGLEADYHFAELQAREPGLPLAQLAAARHARAMVVHVPLWALARNVVSQPYRPPGWPTAVSTSGGNAAVVRISRPLILIVVLIHIVVLQWAGKPVESRMARDS